MDIKTPEFGQHFLSQFGDVTKYDYTETPKDKNPLGHEGITLIIWDGKYNVRLSYNKAYINFLIEDDYYKYVNKNISYNCLSVAHFNYISDVIKYLKSHEAKLFEIKSEFGDNLPIEYIRQEKLDTLV